ncbi:MAG: hypothetical protein EHM42_09725 [Planctomycetaceae bacterium]|nr:MAG: hypothetical protein EHM42_11065 [Planctomycetaceae bacterium]RPI82210.1 MAG: hypothetical protein EHM42_09725 [Planctomycetaceae bacterium]
MGRKQPIVADPEPFIWFEPALTVMLPMGNTDEQPDEPVGIVCRQCGCADLRVWRTRRMRGGRIRRERVCRHCGKRTVTTEHEAMR